MVQVVKGTRYVAVTHSDGLTWMETLKTPIIDLRLPEAVQRRLMARLAMDTDRSDHDEALRQAWLDGIAYWRCHGVTNLSQVGKAVWGADYGNESAGTS